METTPENGTDHTGTVSPYSADEIAEIIKALNVCPDDPAAHSTVHRVEEAARLFNGFSGRGNGPDLNRPPGLRKATSEIADVEMRLTNIAFQLDELRSFVFGLHPDVRRHVDDRRIFKLAEEIHSALGNIKPPQEHRTRPTSEAELAFIDRIASIWEEVTGKDARAGRNPGNGKLGPFARFVFSALAPVKKDQMWAKSSTDKKPLTPGAVYQLIREWRGGSTALPHR
ncbi:hypothetical protein [Azospirillum brasilense]|uniref:hypothetical protein n=1 Tax=Azospirillum brasilense TaxID=192 RepID=UPI0010C04A72|nr:hypothetical protein [Azospirillum brasilense]